MGLIRDGDKGEGGMVGGGGRGRLYTYRYTVTARMIPAVSVPSLIKDGQR